MSSSDKQNTQNEKTMTTKKTKAMPRSCGNTKNKRKNDAATTKSSNKKLVGDNGNKTSSKSADETRNENTTASAEENAGCLKPKFCETHSSEDKSEKAFTPSW